MSEATSHPVVAAFDFDRTLTTRDTVLPFMRSVAGTAGLVRILTRNFTRILSLVARRERNRLKELMCREVFRARPVEEVHQRALTFATLVMDRMMRHDTVARMRWHQAQGDVVVLVSASLSPYLEIVGDLLEVDAVVCTELEVADGLYTGALSGPNCRGTEKWTRLSAWMDDAGLGNSSVAYAYGDSAGDRQMLKNSQRPVWVNRREVAACPS